MEKSGILAALRDAPPLVAVPIIAEDLATAREQACEIRVHHPAPDLVKWRVDAVPPDPLFIGNEEGELRQGVNVLAAILHPIPLLVTVRSRAEGGGAGWDDATREAVLLAAIQSGSVALVDVELAAPEPMRQRIVAAARTQGVGVIVSAHDLISTPPDDELGARLAALIAAGGDVAKLAVMANTPEDALRLLRATARAHATRAMPLITMAMGPLGSITRIVGPSFGSVLAFATIGPSSAPGQLPIDLVRAFWHATGIRLLDAPEKQ